MSNINIHRDLIEKCKRADRLAQHQLYQLYAKQMLNVCHRIVADRMEAEDVLQDSFVSAFCNLERYRGDASFGSWLKRIVINKSLNAVRKKKIYFKEINDETQSIEEEEEEVPLEYTVKDVHQALNQLPNGYRVIFTLYMFEDLSHSEIAEQLDISVATSKSQLSRAKQKLKTIIIENTRNGQRQA